MDYEKEYYKDFGNKIYNVNRPILKTTRKLFRIEQPFSKLTLLSIAFGNFKQLDIFTKKFFHVSGIEINPVAVKEASLDHEVYLADLTLPNTEIKWKSDVVACHYLFEHLNDSQIEVIVGKMCRIGWLINITLTDKDSGNYVKDPTHKNPKTIKEWREFLKPLFTINGFVLLNNKDNSFTFIEESKNEEFKLLVARTQEYYNEGFSKIIEKSKPENHNNMDRWL